MGKIVYYTNHKNIKGNELITVERSIDIMDNIHYFVILESNYTPDEKYRHVIGFYGLLQEAINKADEYQTKDLK